MAAPKFLESIFDGVRNLRRSPTGPVGVGGTAVYGGYVDQKERNPELSGERRWRTYTELIANVSIVAASLRYVIGLVSKGSWSVVPPEDGGQEAEDLAELIEKILFKDMLTPWHKVIRRAALFKPYGFSVQAWTAVKRDDGAIGFLDIEQRPQWTINRWDLDTSGTVHGMVQRSPQTAEEIYIPRTRTLYLVDDTFTDSPDGMGLLRHVAPTAKRLQTLERLEIFGYETDLKGIPLGRAPYSQLRAALKNKLIDQDEFSAAVSALEQTVTNHVRDPERGPMGLLLDSLPYASQDEANTPSSVYQYSLELIKGESAESQVAVAQAIMRLIRELARIFGTEGLLLGESGSGSLAMSKDKSTTVGMNVDSVLADIASAANKDVLNALFLLNGWDPKLKPELRPEKIQNRDASEVTTALADIARAGAPLAPDDPAINAVRRLLGLPDQVVLDVSLTPKLGPDGKQLLDQQGRPIMEKMPPDGEHGAPAPGDEGAVDEENPKNPDETPGNAPPTPAKKPKPKKGKE